LQIEGEGAGARTPRRRRAAQDKAAILRAAQALFLTERYELISSAEIARRAGVEEMLPARYFGGKLALLIRVGEDMADQVLEEFALPPRRGLAGERAVRAVVAQLIGVLGGEASRRLHRLFDAQAREVDRLKDRWRRRLTSTVAARLRDGLGDGAEAAAEQVYDLFLTYIAPAGAEPAATPREIAAWAEAAAAMLLRRHAPAVLETEPVLSGGQDGAAP
jgi:AcrR family transcriptional regulator